MARTDSHGSPGGRLKAQRLNRGLSRARVAMEMGVKPAVVANVETGRSSRPHPQHAKAIADWLGTSVLDLWPLEEEAA